MKKAVVLLSGGLDSTTTLAIAGSKGFELYALSFDYGQRHGIELEAARLNAEKFDVKKHLIVNFNLRDIGGSALTSDMEVPKDSHKLQVASCKLKSKKSNNSSLAPCPLSLIPVTYVPARNTIFLSFALGWAEVLESGDIFIGANAVDYSGYPDCRPEFIKAFEDMANLATRASVEGKCRFKIHAPLINLTKGEIIRQGIELGVDYSLTWSCYDPQLKAGARNSQSPVPCLKCDSCRLRAKGFEEAGIKDPLIIS
ncbi:MAG: 7-cyano-7-deazaguanine synthase QueC [Nitrospiraceae bacterium]|nr:MAG: 7-cyano-7-deazaguanine synthase QueC [Nitrospiraceae bacterium]